MVGWTNSTQWNSVYTDVEILECLPFKSISNVTAHQTLYEISFEKIFFASFSSWTMYSEHMGLLKKSDKVVGFIENYNNRLLMRGCFQEAERELKWGEKMN